MKLPYLDAQITEGFLARNFSNMSYLYWRARRYRVAHFTVVVEKATGALRRSYSTAHVIDNARG